MKYAKTTTEGKAAVVELIKSIASDIKNNKRCHKNNVFVYYFVSNVLYFYRPDEILTNSSKSLESLRILLAEVILETPPTN